MGRILLCVDVNYYHRISGGKELKAIDQSVLGRDMRLLKDASNNVDGKNKAIMETT